MKKFTNKLSGNRVILKKTNPTIKQAKEMFKLVDINRKYLGKWLSWVAETKSWQDSLEALQEREEKVRNLEEIQYGIYLKNELIGVISMFEISEKNKSGEIGYWLAGNFSGNGYMTEAVKIIEKEFFTSFRLNRIEICCDSRNKASAKVAKKAGYKKEACLKEHRFHKEANLFSDTFIFAKLKSDWEKE